METLETIEERPERVLGRVAADQLDHTADAARKASRAKLKAYCEMLDECKRELMQSHHSELFASDHNN